MVRPKWQTEPGKQPNIRINWLAFGIEIAKPDANAYIASNTDLSVGYQRHEELEVQCDLYGPDALDVYGLIRDGFQIDQNRFALFKANLAFVDIDGARVIPDLVNERFVTRRMTVIRLRRMIQREYAIPTILSASGIIYTVNGDEEYLKSFQIGFPAIAVEDGESLETEDGQTIVAESYQIPVSNIPIDTENDENIETESDDVIESE